MENDYDFIVQVTYHPAEDAQHIHSISNKKRYKIWIEKDVANVTDIEFLFNNNEELNVGEEKEVCINVLNKVFFVTLMNSGYKVYFGLLKDIRLGEIRKIIKNNIKV